MQVAFRDCSFNDPLLHSTSEFVLFNLKSCAHGPERKF